MNEADKEKKENKGFLKDPWDLSGKPLASTAGLRIFVLSINIPIYLFRQGLIMQFWLP